jgi:hypothetical protein
MLEWEIMKLQGTKWVINNRQNNISRKWSLEYRVWHMGNENWLEIQLIIEKFSVSILGPYVFKVRCRRALGSVETWAGAIVSKFQYICSPFLNSISQSPWWHPELGAAWLYCTGSLAVPVKCRSSYQYRLSARSTLTLARIHYKSKHLSAEMHICPHL